MAAALRFWTTVMIAAAAAILFAFSASLVADAAGDIEGADLEAVASPLLH